MNKQLMYSIRSEWLEKILNGTKQYEFWKQLPKKLKTGDRVNLYCCKVKPYLAVVQYYTDTPETYLLLKDNSNGYDTLNGKIVCSFEVGEIYRVDWETYIEVCGTPAYVFANIKNPNSELLGRTPSQEEINKQGYTNQRYAIEITNLKIFDEPRELGSYVSVKKGFEYFNNRKFGNNVNCKEMEFRRLHNGIGYYGCKLLKDYEKDCDLTNCLKIKITKAPQSFMYCYDSEEENE